MALLWCMCVLSQDFCKYLVPQKTWKKRLSMIAPTCQEKLWPFQFMKSMFLLSTVFQSNNGVWEAQKLQHLWTLANGWALLVSFKVPFEGRSGRLAPQAMPPITSNLFQQVSYSIWREDPFINLPFRILYHLQDTRQLFKTTFAVDWYTIDALRLFSTPARKKKSDQGTSTWFSCAAIYTGEVPISCGKEVKLRKKNLPRHENPGVEGMLPCWLLRWLGWPWEIWVNIKKGYWRSTKNISPFGFESIVGRPCAHDDDSFCTWMHYVGHVNTKTWINISS